MKIDDKAKLADLHKLVGSYGRYRTALGRSPLNVITGIILDNDSVYLTIREVGKFGRIRRRRVDQFTIEDQDIKQKENQKAEHRPTSQEVRWRNRVAAVKAKGDIRFAQEQERMRKLGIIDSEGRATSADIPDDMKPSQE
jgi:hypothetical protein